jgi:hypothetical protein
MFDDLRQSSAAAVREEEEELAPRPLMERMPVFKDLAPQQRFLVALLILFNVVVLGFGCLLAAGAMMP